MRAEERHDIVSGYLETFYSTNLAELTKQNRELHKTVFKTAVLELVLTYVAPGTELGPETHQRTVQFSRIEKGRGRLLMDGKTYALDDDTAFNVQAGTKHTIIADADGEGLWLYSLYAPPRDFTFLSAVGRVKAKEILRHGSVRGHPLTKKQQRYFKWRAYGKY